MQPQPGQQQMPGMAPAPTAAQPAVASARPAALDETHIDDLLRAMHEKGASDLHIAVGIPPIIRVDGTLVPMPWEKVNAQDSQRLIYDILTDEQIDEILSPAALTGQGR